MNQIRSGQMPLRFTQPFPRLSGIGVIKVTDYRSGERFAEHRHAVLPLLIPDHREAFDIGEVFDAELEVLPGGADIPAMEAGHIEENAQLSVLPDKPFNLRHELIVICLYQLAADVNGEQLAGVFFVELYGHWRFLCLKLRLGSARLSKDSSDQLIKTLKRCAATTS
ncbi:MAG: hypothetical protein WCA45_12725, partial [Thiobacillaceae bacterium]